MRGRRSFLAGLLAAGLVPKPTWAEAGSPDFISAGMTPDGAFVLCGLSAGGEIVFQLPLPARGHAAAAHPARPEAVAFARRPGTFALVIDCITGRETARLLAPEGRHFYGHGAFSADGDLLFTTENDYEAGLGRVGIWDVRRGYVRLGEFSSGGVGPHEIRLMPDGVTLAVANGGIETHPETGRIKLNIPTMRPNLSYLDFDGHTRGVAELDTELRKNSIRHIAVAGDGSVAFGTQWQGDLTDRPPLLGLHNLAQGEPPRLVDAATSDPLQGYVGSVAVDRGRVAITSPRGGRVQAFDARSLAMLTERAVEDVCGVATTADGFIASSGAGLVMQAEDGAVLARHPVRWDNHLVKV
ncbi:MAG: DUF1513 domain-containing protein [Pseudomonadota bacterium]